MEHIKSQNEGLYTSEERHEASDVNVKLILTFGVFLIVLAAAIFVGLYGFYQGLDKWYESRQSPANPMIPAPAPVRSAGAVTPEEAETAEQTTDRLIATFPKPRLQPDEYRDYTVYRRQVEEQLNSYTWIDKNAGKVRIPVSRAIDLVAERGLPVASATAAGTAESKAPKAKATEQPR